MNSFLFFRLHPNGRLFLAALIPFIVVSPFLDVHLFLFFVLFFLYAAWVMRVPQRVLPDGLEGVAVAPTDGVVVALDEQPGPEALNLESVPMTRLLIRLGFLGTHVNFVPVHGLMTHFVVRPGRRVPLSLETDNPDFLHHFSLVSTGHGDVAVVQIGGFLTQKIVTTPSIGAEIQAGDVFGLIRMGSALALYVPSDWVVHVKTGQTLVACETVLATMPKKRAAVRPGRPAKSTRPKQAGGEPSDGSAVVSGSLVPPDVSPDISSDVSSADVETPGASLTVSPEPVHLESDPVSAQEPDQSKEETPDDRASVDPAPDDSTSGGGMR